jgi:hypothetical protein
MVENKKDFIHIIKVNLKNSGFKTEMDWLKI